MGIGLWGDIVLVMSVDVVDTIALVGNLRLCKWKRKLSTYCLFIAVGA